MLYFLYLFVNRCHVVFFLVRITRVFFFLDSVEEKVQDDHIFLAPSLFTFLSRLFF